MRSYRVPAVLSFLALAALILLAAACTGAGELTPQAATVTPAVSETRAGAAIAEPSGPTPTYTCIYTVVDGQAACLPLYDPRVSDFEKCSPVTFQARAACLPPGATNSSVISDAGPVPTGVDAGPMQFGYVRLNNSYVRFTSTDIIDYYVAPEDAIDFGGLKELFLPGMIYPPTEAPAPGVPCRYMVAAGNAACLPPDNALVKNCWRVNFQDHSACLPFGAGLYAVVAGTVTSGIGAVIQSPGDYFLVRRGSSEIKFTSAEVIQYDVAPDDEVDFQGLKLLFGVRQ